MKKKSMVILATFVVFGLFVLILIGTSYFQYRNAKNDPASTGWRKILQSLWAPSQVADTGGAGVGGAAGSGAGGVANGGTGGGTSSIVNAGSGAGAGASRASSAGGQRMPASDRIAAITNFLNDKSSIQKNWRVNLDQNGLMTYAQDGLVENQALTKDAGFAFAQELAQTISSSPVQLSQKTIDPNPTELSKTYTYEQESGAYRVYDGYVHLFVRNSDGAIYMINSGVKDVGVVDSSMDGRFDSAEKIAKVVESQYGARGPRDISVEPTAVVFMVSPGQSVLAWVARVSVKLPKFARYEVVVSARDGTIVSERMISSF